MFGERMMKTKKNLNSLFVNTKRLSCENIEAKFNKKSATISTWFYVNIGSIIVPANLLSDLISVQG